MQFISIENRFLFLHQRERSGMASSDTLRKQNKTLEWNAKNHAKFIFDRIRIFPIHISITSCIHVFIFIIFQHKPIKYIDAFNHILSNFADKWEFAILIFRYANMNEHYRFSLKICIPMIFASWFNVLSSLNIHSDDEEFRGRG